MLSGYKNISHVAQNMIKFSYFLLEIQACASKFDQNLHHLHQNFTLFGIKQVINTLKYNFMPNRGISKQKRTRNQKKGLKNRVKSKFC